MYRKMFSLHFYIAEKFERDTKLGRDPFCKKICERCLSIVKGSAFFQTCLWRYQQQGDQIGRFFALIIGQLFTVGSFRLQK
jgi:hypothetical protein